MWRRISPSFRETYHSSTWGRGTDKDGSSRRNRMMGGTPAHLVDPSKTLCAKTRANAKKRWGKVRNVVRGTLGLAAAAAAMRGGLDEASKLSDGVSTSVEKVSAGSAAALHNHERSDATNKLRPRRSPRLPDGRIVPPWMAPPGYSLPLAKAIPRDIALLRVCEIPRNWAEQWLSGRDVDSATAISMRDGQHAGSSPKGGGRAKRSAMSWDAARIALPHAHTYLFRATGRFVTVVLDRQRVLSMLRNHPIGPSPSTLKEIIRELKAERPLDSGPGPATFDRRLADSATLTAAPRAVMSSPVVEGSLPPGGHEHAWYHELRNKPPGPGAGAYMLSSGFGNRPVVGGH